MDRFEGGPGAIPPLAPGIVTETTRAGRWLFRWRSYLPLVVVCYVLIVTTRAPIPLGGVNAIPYWSLAGIALGLLGYLFRGWTLGGVSPGTSGRGTTEPVAAALNTRHVYSAVRHPLYFGNFLMWIGVTAVTGNADALIVVALTFWIYYERIMIAEERFLYERFSVDFRAWSERTPAFWPRFDHWASPSNRFSLSFALGRDYPALYGLVAATTAVQVARRVALADEWLPSSPWRLYFVVGSVVYVVLLTLKRRTRLLERRDRARASTTVRGQGGEPWSSGVG